MPSQSSASRRRIGEGTNDLRVFNPFSSPFSQRPLCFSKSVFQSLLSFDSPLLHTISVYVSQLSLSNCVCRSFCLFSLFPVFSVALHHQYQPKSALQQQSLNSPAPAEDLHAGSREVCTGGGTNAKGDRSPRLRFPQPSRQQARGPARARGGAQAQPHPRRHRSRDPGLILSW